MYSCHDSFESRGYSSVAGTLEVGRCDALARELETPGLSDAGSHNVLNLPLGVDLAAELKAHPGIAPLLPTGSVAVQCTFFEKTPEKNWLVAFHQDVSIPVRSPVSHPDLRGWSEKEGVMYVQPPLQVLEALVAVRVHLDESPVEGGPLRVVPSSHRHGRLFMPEIDDLRRINGEIKCVAQQGEMLVVRPLLLHASSKVTGRVRRRVLHFLFGPAALPCGLTWHWSV